LRQATSATHLQIGQLKYGHTSRKIVEISSRSEADNPGEPSGLVAAVACSTSASTN